MGKIIKAVNAVIAALLAVNIFSHAVTIIVYLLMFIDSSVKYNEVIDMAIGAVIWYSVIISVCPSAVITAALVCGMIIKYIKHRTFRPYSTFFLINTASIVLWAFSFFLCAFWSV